MLADPLTKRSVPDIMTTAKGLTNGVIPMGAVLVREEIYDAFMRGPDAAIELFHGYTYSGHPVAAAAGGRARGAVATAVEQGRSGGAVFRNGAAERRI